MTPHISLSSVNSISGKLSLLLAGAKKYRPSRLRNIFAVTAPSTTAKTARPTRRLPARSTAIISPSRMPASQRQSPSTRHQNVDDGCRTTHEMGSISSSRSSPAGYGNPALTALATRRTGIPFAMTGVSTGKQAHGFPLGVLAMFSRLSQFDMMSQWPTAGNEEYHHE